MTGAVLNNIIQPSNNDFSSTAKNKNKAQDAKSFLKTLQSVEKNSSSKQRKSLKTNQKSAEKDSVLTDKDFLVKLKKILAKNNKEVPAELMALLQGGSLTEQQETMLGKMISNLKNNNLKLTDLKSLVQKNAESFAELDLNGKTELRADNLTESDDLEALDSKKITELIDLLEADKNILSQKERAQLKTDLNQLAASLLEANSLSEAENNKLKSLLNSEDLNLKLKEIAGLLNDSNLASDDFRGFLKAEKISTPLVAKISESLKTAFKNSAQSAELVSKIEVQLDQKLAQSGNNKQQLNLEALKVEANKLFNSDLDTALDLSSSFAGADSESESNFFTLEDSEGLINFDFNSDLQNNDLSLNNLNSETKNLAELVKNADLKAQVVEKFSGEYSPETKEMQIQLKPESLGKIDLSLSYENDKLLGKMIVESELVRAQLESSLKGLKTDLIKQGINIEQFKIETAKNSAQQVEKQDNFAFNDQNSAFSDGDTGHNQEYDQRQFFQGQYYVQKNKAQSNLNADNLIMRQQEIINRAAFSNDNLNLLA